MRVRSLVWSVAVCGWFGLAFACAADPGDDVKGDSGSALHVVDGGALQSSAASKSTSTGVAHTTASSVDTTSAVMTGAMSSTSVSTTSPSTTSSSTTSSSSSTATSGPLDASADATNSGGDASFDLCTCMPNKCGDCATAEANCTSTDGCVAIMQCVHENTAACGGRPEQCTMCEQGTSTAAEQAAGALASCMGGCQ